MIRQDRTPIQHYNSVFDKLRKHHNMYRKCIPLIASENVTSPAVREAILCDFGHRYAEGWPGERVYAGCKYIDEVELLCSELARQVFDADFADVRPVSGVSANLSVYTAFTKPGEVLLSLSIPSGGHISTGKDKIGGTAGAVRGLQVEYFPFDEYEMTIDVGATEKKIAELEKMGTPPKLAMFGGSLLLFPQPVRELSEILHQVGATVCYDAAHVAGLISGGQFQDPLREGADVVTLSTHKVLFGPQGGMILSFQKYADAIKRAVFPGNVSNHHLHHVAGKAVALTEIMQFGAEYARQVVANAVALAKALNDKGIQVLGEHKGFTKSHQVVLDVTKYGLGGDLERTLEHANIIVNRNLLARDIKEGRHFQNPGGIRLGTQECTRLGMKEDNMDEVADLISRVIVGKESPTKVSRRVAEFRKDFQKVFYCFHSTREAYEYIRLR